MSTRPTFNPSQGRTTTRTRSPTRQPSLVNSLITEIHTLLPPLIAHPVPTQTNKRTISRLIVLYRHIATLYRQGHADPPIPPQRPATSTFSVGHTGTGTGTGTSANSATKPHDEEWKALQARTITAFELWASLLEEALECADRGDRVGFERAVGERFLRVEINPRRRDGRA